MNELESELDNPTGVTTARAPPLILDGILISSDCGILFETRNTKGLKCVLIFYEDTFYSFVSSLGSKDFGGKLPHVRPFLLFKATLSQDVTAMFHLDAGYAFVVYVGLLVLLARQVESDASRTPAGLSRVSRWSFIAQAGTDGFSFVGVCSRSVPLCVILFTISKFQHLLFGIFADNRSSLSLIAPGFLACLLVVYQVVSPSRFSNIVAMSQIRRSCQQYAILINQIQGPEDAALRETTRTSSPSDQSDNRDPTTPSDSDASPQSTTRGTGFLSAIRSRFLVEPQTRFCAYYLCLQMANS
jgi:transmembrane E3 ubiquitin-protein ligase